MSTTQITEVLGELVYDTSHTSPAVEIIAAILLIVCAYYVYLARK